MSVLTRLKSKYRRWGALSPDQRRLFIWASLALPLYWCGLRTFGLLRMKTWIEGAQNKRVTWVDSDVAVLISWGAAVNQAARWSPFPVTCLTRSLLLHRWMVKNGVPSQLCIGVKINEGVFAAHAWVECSGCPVNDTQAVVDEYVPIHESTEKFKFD